MHANSMAFRSPAYSHAFHLRPAANTGPCQTTLAAARCRPCALPSPSSRLGLKGGSRRPAGEGTFHRPARLAPSAAARKSSANTTRGGEGASRAERGPAPGGGESSAGAVLLGTLTCYRNQSLRGSAALRNAFPHTRLTEATPASADHGPGGGGTVPGTGTAPAAEAAAAAKQAVQLYARLPGGQLGGPYCVTLWRGCQLSRVTQLVRDLGLRDDDCVALSRLTDGRVVAEAAAAAGTATQPPKRLRRPPGGEPGTATVLTESGGRARFVYATAVLRRAFPDQMKAVTQGGSPQRVRVYARPPGSSGLHPYALKLQPRRTPDGVYVRLPCTAALKKDLGLQDGDVVRVSVQPDGRVVLEPANPRPGVDPNLIQLTEAAIRRGRVSVPVRIVARLLGEERSRSVPSKGDVIGFFFRLEDSGGGWGGRTGRLRGYGNGKGGVRWFALRLTRWLRSQNAAAGDALWLGPEDEGVGRGSAEAEGKAKASAAWEAAALASGERPLVARLVRSSSAASSNT